MTMQAEAEAEVGFQVSAQLTANLGRVADEMALRRQYQNRLSQKVHPFTIPPVPFPALVSSAATLNQPNMFGPQLSNIWVVHRIAVLGFTAGTVSVYLNQAGAELIDIFTPVSGAAPRPNFYGKGQVTLTGNDNLVFVGSGITASGNFAVSIAGVEIAADLTGDYFI